MGAGYGNRYLIILHDLSEQLGAGQHGEALNGCACEFRVIRVNGCGINDHINIISNICGRLPIDNVSA